MKASKVLKFFLKVGLVLILFAGILFIASKFLEQKIVEKAINIMNSKLEVPVLVENISFSLLKKFPEATLELKNLTILSGNDFNSDEFTETFADTLVYIKQLYLSVSLISLYYDKLEISKAYAQKGMINILIDKNGFENFMVFKALPKKPANDTANSKFAFLLNHIQLRQISINFINKYKKTGLGLYTPNYTIKGNLYKKEYAATTSGKLLLSYFKQGTLLIKPDSPANIEMNLNVKNNLIEIQNSTIQSNDLNLMVNGKLLFAEKFEVNITIEGQSKNINELAKYIFADNIFDYTAKGQLGISAVIQGALDNVTSPAVAVNFKLENGSINFKKADFFLKNIKLEGSYSNGANRNLNSSAISLKQFFIATESSSVNGTCKLVNFNKPLIDVSGSAKLNLADIDNLLHNDGSFQISGVATGNFHFQGNYDSNVKNKSLLFKQWSKACEFNLTDGSFHLFKPELNVNSFSSKVHIQNNELSVSMATANVQNSMLSLTGSIIDYYTPFIDAVCPINIKADIKTDKFEYEKFKGFFENDTPDSTSRTINYSGNFETGSFYYEKFEASNLNGNINYLNDNLQVTNLTFNAMEGWVKGNINYLCKSNNNYLLQTQAVTNKVNINTLFKTFNNFGQTFIKDENLEGYLYTNFDLEMMFNNAKAVLPSIELLGHAQIENGKLHNFQPIIEVSKFADITELKNIEFLSLQNDILISNSTINIPKMQIESNAFDISLYGTQKFNGDYTYHLQVNLSDFIGGKSKRLAKQQSEFGYIEDDGFGKRTLFLVAKSTNNKSKVSLDGDEIKKNLKSGITLEKKELKKALHDEFGWFKKDTSLNKPEKQKKEPEFIIEWDE